MGILVLSLGFAVHVPSSPGDLFLCLSCDVSCRSNLLAGTSLKTTKWVWVALRGPGQNGAGGHLAQRGFSISFIWASFQEEDVTYEAYQESVTY